MASAQENAYQRFLKAQNFNGDWDPQAYQQRLASQQQVSQVHGQITQQHYAMERQQDARHNAAYQQQYQQILGRTQQEPSFAEQMRVGVQPATPIAVPRQQLTQQAAAQAVFNPLETKGALDSVRAPHTYKDAVAPQQHAMQQHFQQQASQLGLQQINPAQFNEVAQRLNPEQFQEYIVFYKPDCAHSMNLLSVLARDSTVDAKCTKVDITKRAVQGLIGVPTITDGKQSYLGDDALRWVNAKITREIKGMDVEDVGAAVVGNAMDVDTSNHFSYVQEHLLQMPQLNENSLQPIKTKTKLGPQIEQEMQMIEQKRNAPLKPYGDTGLLQPLPQNIAPTTGNRVPYQANAAAMLSDRPQMNRSNRGNMNQSYEMTRGAMFGTHK